MPITVNARLLLRNQTNPAENGLYVFTGAASPLIRWDAADEPAELNGAVVTVAAFRDPATQAYSSKTFMQTAAIAALGTDAVVFADGSTTSAGRRAWEMGTTGGGSLSQTPLRAPTVFNFFEPDYVFPGDTGISGLYSPEFQITSETSVINTANWFNELTLRNDSNPVSVTTNGQGFSYGNPIKRDVKLDLSAELPFAHDGGLLADRLTGMLMPNQMSARLRALLADYINSLPETLIPAGSQWRYFTDAAGLGGSNIVAGNASWSAANWKHPGFADASWLSGNAQFGYGEGDEATVLPFGPNTAARWITSYYRKEFTVTDALNVASLTLRLKRDDGAIVYINGQEAVRDNMNAGTATGTTTATGGAPDDGQGFITLTIPANLLSEGRNVIAVEIHQSGGTSSDVSFDLEMQAVRNGTPSFNVATPDRIQRITEALYLLSLTPEFALQN